MAAKFLHDFVDGSFFLEEQINYMKLYHNEIGIKDIDGEVR